MRNASKEKIEFAQRLADAMEMKGIKQSPTTLQKLFNECFEGKPVKMHTARKWLLGSAFPRQDKLVCLAKLLGTSSEYLHFGTDNGSTFIITQNDGSAYELPYQQKQFVRRYLTLTISQQRLVNDLVVELAIN